MQHHNWEKQLIESGFDHIPQDYRNTEALRKSDSPVTNIDTRRTELFQDLEVEGLTLTARKIEDFLKGLPRHAPRYHRYHYYKGMAFGMEMDSPASMEKVEGVIKSVPNEYKNMPLYHFYLGLIDGLFIKQMRA